MLKMGAETQLLVLMDLYPDRHLDPDPQKMNADPQPCFTLISPIKIW